MTLYFSCSLTAIRTLTFGYIKWPQMLPLLAVSLILCLVSMSGKGWAKKAPPRTQNYFIITSFHSKISPMVPFMFREKWEAGVWNWGILRILFWILSISYIEIILEATIYRFFSPRCTMWHFTWWKSSVSGCDYGLPHIDGKNSL